MNERIRELIKQAEEYATIEYAYIVDLSKWKECRDQKFAELIVRECVDICNNTNGASYLNGVYAGRQIKQHFGVEE